MTIFARTLVVGVVLAAALCAPGVGRADDTSTRSKGPTSSLDADRFRAFEPGDEGSMAIAHVLADYQQRGDGEGGFAWWMKLPIAVRSRQASHSEARYWRNRVEFLRDAQRKDAVSCAISGRPVLSDEHLGCDYAIELNRYLECTGGLSKERRTELVNELRERATSRLDGDVRRCPEAAPAIETVHRKLDRDVP